MPADAYTDFIRVDEREYHQDRDRLSASVLDLVARDPREFRDWLAGRSRKPTPEMCLGSYVHALALEGPDVAKRKVAIAPNQHQAYRALSKAEKKQWDETGIEPPRTQQDPSPAGEWKTMQSLSEENRRQWRDFEASARNRIIIKPEQIPTATAMFRALSQHHEAGPLLKRGTFEPEMAGFWTCPHTGVPMRCMLDGLGSEYKLELKCTSHCDPTSDVVTWIRYGWARKDAIYHDAEKEILGESRPTIWMFVEMTDNDPKVAVRRTRSDSVFAVAGRDGVRDKNTGEVRFHGYIDLIMWAQRYRETGVYKHAWELETDADLHCPAWIEHLVMEGDARRAPPIEGVRMMEVSDG